MRVLLDLAFPPSCSSCGAFGHRFLCPACADALVMLERACARCAMPRARPVDSCWTCAGARFAFSAARAATVYDGVGRDVVMSYKLGGERRIARHIAALMAPAVGEVRPGAVTFVPATKRSIAARGFDPAAEIARHLGRAVAVTVRPMLRKVRETVDQAGLDAAQRRRNQAGAYAATRPVQGLVALVDDILTTGATADACARALIAAGASDVAVVVFARTP